MKQFFNTVAQIVNSDSVMPVVGLARHFRWQVRRALHQFPCDLVLGQSILHVKEHAGVAALVNAMGEYDYNNMNLLKILLREGGTFVDVGANIGSYTLVASENPAARVISIEPHPKTYQLLVENVARNGRDNVTCLNLAVSSIEGEAYLSDLNESSINQIVPERGGPNKLKVMCRRLDSLLLELGATPSVIKIDVEGHEAQVVEGMGSFLSELRVALIEGGSRIEVARHLQAVGMRGPLFAHVRERRFSAIRQARPEDPIFVGNLPSSAQFGFEKKVA
jgi:FkbM family methyltransferase